MRNNLAFSKSNRLILALAVLFTALISLYSCGGSTSNCTLAPGLYTLESDSGVPGQLLLNRSAQKHDEHLGETWEFKSDGDNHGWVLTIEKWEMQASEGDSAEISGHGFSGAEHVSFPAKIENDTLVVLMGPTAKKYQFIDCELSKLIIKEIGD